jgi:hypothetical protein
VRYGAWESFLRPVEATTCCTSSCSALRFGSLSRFANQLSCIAHGPKRNFELPEALQSQLFPSSPCKRQKASARLSPFPRRWPSGAAGPHQSSPWSVTRRMLHNLLLQQPFQLLLTPARVVPMHHSAPSLSLSPNGRNPGPCPLKLAIRRHLLTVGMRCVRSVESCAAEIGLRLNEESTSASARKAAKARKGKVDVVEAQGEESCSGFRMESLSLWPADRLAVVSPELKSRA